MSELEFKDDQLKRISQLERRQEYIKSTFFDKVQASLSASGSRPCIRAQRNRSRYKRQAATTMRNYLNSSMVIQTNEEEQSLMNHGSPNKYQSQVIEV